MITLKDYQVRVLDSLRGFFSQCSRDGHPANAFHDMQVKNGRDPVPYIPVHAAGLVPSMPYVCLRVPTGGGKTLLACHTAGIAMKQLLRAERSVVLWLVPRSTILQQTAEALRDNRHPYRRALEMECGSVEVVTIDEALRLSRAAVDGQTVVIVATIQSFRAEDTAGRKVYGQNGSFAEHLQNVPAGRLDGLLEGADGKPVPSLVNMLRLRRPIVIVDEAHNARTELSFAMLGDVKPSCIIEFTATPARKKNPSNVLHMVSAAELNAANMVKLPLKVFKRDPSQRDLLLADAVSLRSDLEKQAVAEAQATGEYIRPIMLIQAERIDDCIPLRERLVAEFGIEQKAILISTGKLDELAKVKDIESPKCPVRIIITVQKLSEGWDCPFAYVLCSLKQTRSATAIEQIVGRILRLPKVEKKQIGDLNCSYVFSVSDSLGAVLAELRDALESNGFTKAEAERIVLPVSQGILPMGVQPRKVQVKATEMESFALNAEAAALAGKVEFDPASGDLTIFVPLDESEVEALSGCVSEPESRQLIQDAAEQVREMERAFGGSGDSRNPSPYERQLDFIVPLLSVLEDGRLFEFEKTFLLEQPWELSRKDASLSVNYNPLKRPAAQRGVLDIGEKGEVTSSAVQETADDDFIVSLHQQVLQLGGSVDWTLESLISWLDRRIDHRDIPYGESAEFLRKVIRGLMAQFEFEDVGLLALDRYRLCDQIESRIREHREAEHKVAFQQFLIPDSALQVAEEVSINFKTMVYEPSQIYAGGFLFKKHYFGPKPGELEEKTPSGKIRDEFKCAQYIDMLDEVECWVRNLARKSTSFRLQTSTDWFYPDFVCLLKDGRVAAIEYKGGHIYSAEDAEEKRAVGAVWAERSGGQCLFIMPEDDDLSAIESALRE